MTERVCTNCAFCSHEAVGYSEYTITGEELVCMKALRPDIDTEYANDADVAKLNAFAATCDSFHEGTGPRLGYYSDDKDADLAAWAKETGLEVPEQFK